MPVVDSVVVNATLEQSVEVPFSYLRIGLGYEIVSQRFVPLLTQVQCMRHVHPCLRVTEANSRNDGCEKSWWVGAVLCASSCLLPYPWS